MYVIQSKIWCQKYDENCIINKNEYKNKNKIGWSSCEKGYIWDPSTCDCKCYKTCGTGTQLDFKNCACKERVVDNLGKTYEDKILRYYSDWINFW